MLGICNLFANALKPFPGSVFLVFAGMGSGKDQPSRRMSGKGPAQRPSALRKPTAPSSSSSKVAKQHLKPSRSTKEPSRKRKADVDDESRSKKAKVEVAK